MIIDALLDRMDGCPYSISKLDYIKDEARVFEFKYLVKAINSWSEMQIKLALNKYVKDNGYANIKGLQEYIFSVNWF